MWISLWPMSSGPRVHITNGTFDLVPTCSFSAVISAVAVTAVLVIVNSVICRICHLSLSLMAITPVPFTWLTVVTVTWIIPSPVLGSNGDPGCIHRWVDVLSQTVHDQWCAARFVDPKFTHLLSLAFTQMVFSYPDIGCF
ncbi:hypothetical protein B0H16DRAFT_1525919 [Mycena metata]|uniref:Uncharacterized protein n=1 Tax=Mycena metata TaxID=1033252 RepID=A0AAD7DG57_9AGAR|nr:hypothetical protein B0H16DRAFT_1654925 [Mycena metata]KAJ7764848.1 hypothetical protein B0H16DRAFT_1525919 [Mycena metata]